MRKRFFFTVSIAIVAVGPFSILSKAGTEFGSKHGRAALVTNYYEVKFKADASGNVTVDE